jgi:hypothetical protein
LKTKPTKIDAKLAKAARKPMVIVVPGEFLRTTEAGEREVDPGVWFCRIGNVEYHSSISREAVETCQSWTPSEPLPLSYDRAVKVARRVLHKLVRTASSWTVTEITLQRLRHALPERWFFVVGFGRESGAAGVFQICVDFCGRPGTITKARKT